MRTGHWPVALLVCALAQIGSADGAAAQELRPGMTVEVNPARINHYMWLRSGPGTSYSKLGKFRRGSDQYRVVAVSGQWAEIDAPAYCVVGDYYFSGTPARATARRNINVRSGPTTSAGVVGWVVAGDRVSSSAPAGSADGYSWGKLRVYCRSDLVQPVGAGQVEERAEQPERVDTPPVQLPEARQDNTRVEVPVPVARPQLEGQAGGTTLEGEDVDGGQESATDTAQREYVIVVGGEGVSSRHYMSEDCDGGAHPRPRSWGTFIWAAELRLKRMRWEDLRGASRVTLVLWRPDYEKRLKRERRDKEALGAEYTEAMQEILSGLENYMDAVNAAAAALDVRLPRELRTPGQGSRVPVVVHPIDTLDQFFAYFNEGGAGVDRSRTKIAGWEYFGHGLPSNLNLEYDYGERDEFDIRGVHVVTPRNVRRFDREAVITGAGMSGVYFRSWACRTAMREGGSADAGHDRNNNLLHTIQQRLGGLAVGPDCRTSYDQVRHSTRRRWARTLSLGYVGGPPERLPYPVNNGNWIVYPLTE